MPLSCLTFMCDRIIFVIIKIWPHKLFFFFPDIFLIVKSLLFIPRFLFDSSMALLSLSIPSLLSLLLVCPNLVPLVYSPSTQFNPLSLIKAYTISLFLKRFYLSLNFTQFPLHLARTNLNPILHLT